MVKLLTFYNKSSTEMIRQSRSTHYPLPGTAPSPGHPHTGQ